MTTTIAQVYQKIRQSPSPDQTANEYCFQGLTDQEIAAAKSKGCEFYRGKVRDLMIGDKDIRMLHSDRLTAFDKFICLIPCKGMILNSLSAFWLKEVNQIVPTHLIKVPDARELLVKKTTPFKVEVIVRGYLAGSMARAYTQGVREFCGVKLPENLKSYQKLPEIIITPTTKAAVFEHDENISAEELIARGVCSAREWDQIRMMALQVFKFGCDLLAKHGWLLVDTKYEFGKDEKGNVIVIDEVHTPDSSRFWIEKTYRDLADAGKSPEMLDKEIVRRWLIDHGFSGEGKVPTVPMDVRLQLAEVYLAVAEKLTGRPLPYIQG